MSKPNAVIMCFSDGEQERAGTYYNGTPKEVVTLLAAAGIADEDFGDIIIHAALAICEKLEEKAKSKT
jgi:hypothetical protein